MIGSDLVPDFQSADPFEILRKGQALRRSSDIWTSPDFHFFPILRREYQQSIIDREFFCLGCGRIFNSMLSKGVGEISSNSG
jgi:hypothetical protein